MNQERTRLSRFLSLVLRHRPEVIGLQLDPNGWVSVRELIDAVAKAGHQIDPDILDKVVEQNDKQRFAFDETRTRIRASQGHSVSVDLALEPKTPPELLYHGTASRNLDSIRRSGLQKQQRHHVHLTANHDTARAVGARYGHAVVLTVRTGDMHRDGCVFYQSENAVWLVDNVPARYIDRSTV